MKVFESNSLTCSQLRNKGTCCVSCLSGEFRSVLLFYHFVFETRNGSFTFIQQFETNGHGRLNGAKVRRGYRFAMVHSLSLYPKQGIVRTIMNLNHQHHHHPALGSPSNCNLLVNIVIIISVRRIVIIESFVQNLPLLVTPPLAVGFVRFWLDSFGHCQRWTRSFGSVVELSLSFRKQK